MVKLNSSFAWMWVMLLIFPAASAFSLATAPVGRIQLNPTSCLSNVRSSIFPDRACSVKMSAASSSSRDARKSAAFATVALATIAALSGSSSARSVLAESLGPTLVATTSLQFFPAYVTLTYGYGLIMARHALKFRSLITSTAGTHAMVACVLAYGIKVCLFQAARDSSPEYRKKVLPSFSVLEKTDTKCPVTRTWHKTPLNLVMAALMSFYSLPLYFIASAGNEIATSVFRTRTILFGSGLCWFGVALQLVADIQKFYAKAKHGAEQPILDTGLWRFSRHPNYLGDMLFHVGVGVAAVASCSSAATAFLCSIAPSALLGLDIFATESLDMRQRSTYEKNPAYLEYMAKTPKLAF